MEVSDMSFSVSLDNGRGCEWGSRNGLSSLFAQKRNIFNPYFWQMITEFYKFNKDALKYIEEMERNPDTDRNETLGEFLKSHGYSALFQKAYLVPACRSIWPCPPDSILNFSAYSVLSFCRNHHLLQIFERPQWLTVAGRSETYAAKVRAELERRGCKIRMNCNVQSVSTSEDGCILVTTEDGSQEVFDRCILAVNAPDALRLLGEDATSDEARVLGAFHYAYSDIYLHRDTDLMPRNRVAWSAWNFLTSSGNKASLTYWLNIIQNLGEEHDPFFLTFNPEVTPKMTLFKWTSGHPLPSVSAWKASQELNNIKGKRGLWFCGSYQGYGCHEDEIKEFITSINNPIHSAQSLLGKEMVSPPSNPKHMAPSITEKGARFLFTRFLRHFISTGCVTVDEEGGTMFTFKGNDLRCNLESVIKIHSPHFYWKVMTQADLGLADAYINGDFSFADKDSGLLNLIMDRITFELCDYRQLSDARKYDRIISCEMIEHVGHEFMDTFFSHCEAALAEDGIFVLQFISIPEERYNEYRLNSDFIKEYIFPGGCLPSLARVISAMASSSRLSVENVENIGIHYYQTLRCWRKNFLENQKQIMDLGFDDKFIRTWEYYFDYCAAGFKTLTLEDYQVVFSRPGNVAAFGDPFHSFPYAHG
ncbi:hypothetical protein BRARA_G00593 [Brassica rapa]|uniref:Amine oxidase domain-containing protein n=1 Tax=Brassica campestris TaxID=3711 RepID=A0A397YI84_BRACM|nr:hypothetical protein BRARA_G00593 [Brassica rapa]